MIDPNEIVTVNFMEIKWPSGSKPTLMTKDVRLFFLEDCVDEHKQVIDMISAKDILQAYLFDEHDECPERFAFQIVNKIQ